MGLAARKCSRLGLSDAVVRDSAERRAVGIAAVRRRRYAAAGTVSGVVFQDFDGDGTRDAGDTATGVQTDTGFGGVHRDGVRTARCGGRHRDHGGRRQLLDRHLVGPGRHAPAHRVPRRQRGDGRPAPRGLPVLLRRPRQRHERAVRCRGRRERRLRRARAGGLRRQQRADHDGHPVRRAAQRAGGQRPARRRGQPVGGAGERPGQRRLPRPRRSGDVRRGGLGLGHWPSPDPRTPPTPPRTTSGSRSSARSGSAASTGSPTSSTRTPAPSTTPRPARWSPGWTSPTLGVDVGTVPTSAERGLGLPNALVRDPDAFTNAGKVGIGGIAVNEDGTTLYFVNLFDKDLYAVDISGGATPTTATRIPLGLECRPAAVGGEREPQPRLRRLRRHRG